ncbi:MAG: NUDIX domain-containing protein [Alphaproteobacteria bacterium]|nr:NUDIX domain-containing protein [Alphaproteobacteria bacterium]
MSGRRFPVSIKGVVSIDGKFCLLKNERHEWELPGGRLEPGETPEAACVREIAEELGIEARIERILDTWVYDIIGAGEVLIVTYACAPLTGAIPRLSDEHKALGLFGPTEIGSLNMPVGYKRSLAAYGTR